MRSLSHAWARSLALVGALVLGGCGGGTEPPEVVSFSSPQAEGANAGTTITLLAEFAGGTGAIDQGVGPVASGVPVAVTLNATTTYTLTVTSADGESVTASLQVPVVYRAEWALDGPDPAWSLTSSNGGVARYDQGMLRLSGGDTYVEDEDGFGDYVCASGSARLELTDPTLAESRFAVLTVSLRGIVSSGSGMGYPSVRIRYADRDYWTIIDDGETELDLVVSKADGRLSVYSQGKLLRGYDGVVSVGAPAVVVNASGCSADLGSASVRLDQLLLEAR
jgi:hypothetical protein